MARSTLVPVLSTVPSPASAIKYTVTRVMGMLLLVFKPISVPLLPPLLQPVLPFIEILQKLLILLTKARCKLPLQLYLKPNQFCGPSQNLLSGRKARNISTRSSTTKAVVMPGDSSSQCPLWVQQTKSIGIVRPTGLPKKLPTRTF